MIDADRYPHAVRGIGLLVLGTTCFGCLDTFSKILVAYYPAPALVWLRFVLQTLVMAVIFVPRMGLGLVRTTSLGLQVVRGLFLIGSSILFVLSLGHMQIAEAAAITFFAPVIVALAVGWLLGEHVHARTWFALAGGFTGALLIVRPGGAAFDWYVILPLVCALSVAGYQVLTRKLAGRDDPITTLFFPGLLACVMIPAVVPGSFYVVPTELPHAAAFIAIGIFGSVGHFLLIRSHSHAPATILAPFNYVQIPLVLVIGWLIFAQLPDGIALTGIALIVASGLGLILASRRKT